MQRHTLLVPGLVLHKRVQSFQEALIFMCHKEESNFPLLGAGERIPTPEPDELRASEEWANGAPPEYCHSPVKVCFSNRNCIAQLYYQMRADVIISRASLSRPPMPKTSSWEVSQ